MPKYEYLCSACENTFTEIHSYKEVLAECPECNALDTLSKVLNTPVNLSYKRVQKVSKPGMAVNDAIMSTKQEIEVHKEELKNREANSDD
jgi:putative FmdB family regulatory protein